MEPFEGLGYVQAHVEKLTVHHSVHLLKVSETRSKPMDALSQQTHNNITDKSCGRINCIRPKCFTGKFTILQEVQAAVLTVL